MHDTNASHLSVVARFRQLHANGCFVMPNPWDVGTAVYLEHLGFKAVATTSAGFAFSRALTDSVSAVTCEAMLAHITEVVAATSLPVNADFQTGYAIEPKDVATNVALCVATGVAGLSIEDGSGDPDGELLFPFDLAVERIRAARSAIDASGVPVILTGRCEAWLVGQTDPFGVSLKRLVAYAEAGADCLYAPGVRDARQIEALVKAVSPKPVNVLMSAPSDLSVSSLTDLGVRRISVGAAFARVAWGAFIRAAKSIRETGSFDSLGEAASFNEVNDVFLGRRG